MSDAMDALERNAQHVLNRMRDLSDDLAAVRIRESSSSGAVTVEVDANGALVDLTLSQAISRLSPAEFEQLLLTTAQRAATRAFAARGDLITAFNSETAE